MPTDKQHFTTMLLAAGVVFTERRNALNQDTGEVDGGNGAVALFTFDAEGTLTTFAIDKDAYEGVPHE